MFLKWFRKLFPKCKMVDAELVQTFSDVGLSFGPGGSILVTDVKRFKTVLEASHKKDGL